MKRIVFVALITAITLLGIYNKSLQMSLAHIIFVSILFLAVPVIIWLIVIKMRNKKYGPDESIYCSKYYSWIWDTKNWESKVAILSNNKENLKEFSSELGEMKVCKFLFERNFLIRISDKEDKSKILESINSLLKRLDYKKQITIEELHSNDDEYIIERRKSKYPTYEHDLNVITRILRENNYEVVLIREKDHVVLDYVGIIKLEDIVEFENINRR